MKKRSQIDADNVSLDPTPLSDAGLDLKSLKSNQDAEQTTKDLNRLAATLSAVKNMRAR